MELLNWIGWKLLGVLAVVVLLLVLLYAATAAVPWLFAIKSQENALMVRVLVMSVLAMVLIASLHEYLPEFYEEIEAEILEELIIHEHPPLFRISLVIGATGLFAASMLSGWYWPFAIGVMIGGTVVWLFVVDVAAALFVSGIEGIEEIGAACHSEDIVTTQAVGLGLILLTGVLSWLCYQGIRQPPPPPIVTPAPASQPKSGLWSQLRDLLTEVKKSAPKIWQSKKNVPAPEKQQAPPLQQFPQLEKRLHKLMEKSKIDDIKKLLLELRRQKKHQQDQDCIDAVLRYLDEKSQNRHNEHLWNFY